MTIEQLAQQIAAFTNNESRNDIQVVKYALDYLVNNTQTFAELDYLHRMQQPLKGITPVALGDYDKVWSLDKFKIYHDLKEPSKGFGFYLREMQPSESIFKFLNTQIVFLPSDLDKGITNGAEYIIWYLY